MNDRPPAPARSADAAVWIAPRLTGGFGAVTRAVPSAFEAYARIFHPADPGGAQPWRWADVAAANNRTMHAVAQWSAVSTTESRNAALADVHDPPLGDLEPESLRALADVLQVHTPVTDCWFAMWQGWGDFHARAATFSTPGRDYFLFAGPLADVTRFGTWHTADWFSPRSPNLFWPDDRSWCVASEIDFDSTLVGGSAALIADITASEELEAWPIGPDDSLAWDADWVNVGETD